MEIFKSFAKLGTIVIFVASAFGATFIIYSSIIVGDDGDEEVLTEESSNDIEKSVNDKEDEILE